MEKNEDINNIDNAFSELVKKGNIQQKKILFFPLCDTEKEAKYAIGYLSKKIDKTIGELIWQPEYDKVVKWMTNPTKGLLMTGDPGRLKTTIAKILIVLYKKRYDFNLRLIDSDKIEQEDNQNYINTAPVILIDDVGEEPVASDFGIKYEVFPKLVDFCEKKSKLLILTTNQNSINLKARYGTRPIDRLDLLCHPIKFEGKSFR